MEGQSLLGKFVAMGQLIVNGKECLVIHGKYLSRSVFAFVRVHYRDLSPGIHYHIAICDICANACRLLIFCNARASNV